MVLGILSDSHGRHDTTARAVAARTDVIPAGLLYYNPSAERYDRNTVEGLDMPVEQKVEAVQQALDRFLI